MKRWKMKWNDNEIINENNNNNDNEIMNKKKW